MIFFSTLSISHMTAVGYIFTWSNFNTKTCFIKAISISYRKYHLTVLFNTYAQSSRTQISVSFDGKDLILFNKTHSYFEIYSIDRQLLSANDRDLIGADEGEYDEQGLFSNGINFYTSLALIYSGICRNIAWHQYKSQFSAICGLDKNGILVNYVTQKQKKPLFGKSSSKVQPKKTGEIKSWHVCLFQKVSKKDSPSEYQIILTSPPIQTKIYSLFSTGQQFAYSITQKSAETGNEIQRLQFMSSKGITKQVQGIVVTPQKIYTSYCQTFHIYCYEGYFIIFRVQQNGCLSYYRSIQETIFQGLFWQKLFFFATKSGIYFLQILNQTICIRIACNSPQKESKQSNDVFQNTKVRSNQQWDENGMKQLYEDLQQQCHLTPDGQLQMIGVVNMNLLLVNQIGRQHFLDLKAFPYIEFCMQISSGYLQKAGQIFKSSCGQIQQLMKQTLNSYGLILSSIM